MHGSSNPQARSGSGRGPEVYYGYCDRTKRYRMMDLPDYMSNMQQGMSRWASDASTMMQDMAGSYSGPGQTYATADSSARRRHEHDCGCNDCGHNDCHCECCICDADAVVHARCGEVRRIPVTFENDTRREKPVKLELEKFVTAGGHDLGWPAQLSETEFTLRPCDERTISVMVRVRCDLFVRTTNPATAAPAAADSDVKASTPIGIIVDERFGSVDRCEVGYATLRAEGCLVRPIVIAVAVLPDDCDSYRRPCSCGCCH
jgi:hypothetical protein